VSVDGLAAMDSVQALPYAHVAATGVMVGVIWFCQLVHYPLLALVSDGTWGKYEVAHCNRITAIVGPAMAVEAVSAAALCAPGIWWEGTPWTAWASLALLAVIWASTAFLQVPLHAKLGHGRDEAALRKLVATNWIRTVAWSARLPLALMLLP